jgi:hypothetical protein
MKFMKHIGRHGDRKVAVLFREVPQEDHMCLVIYPDTLPAPWESAIMKVIESDVGQQSENFADALHRSLLPDGRVILETLHREKMIKKIRTADVVMTPRTDSSIRLDELNKMLNEMKSGEAEAAFKNRNAPQPAESSNDALSDRAIASNMLAQAQRMEAEGKGLLSEAARMRKDAERMDPGVVASKAVAPAQEPAKKRGRPAKVTAENAA